MASISQDDAGNVRIQFASPDRKRKTLRLGKVSRKLAESINSKVETLNAIAIAMMPMDSETARWVAGIGDELAAKLAAVGLIPERPRAVTLAGLLAHYAAKKEAGNKPGTRTNHRTITNDLTGFFAPNSDPKRITEADAKGFLEHLRKRKLASYTVARRVRRVRSIFAFAVVENLIPANPFAGVKASATLPDDRKAYVTAADAEKLLAAAAPAWRTIIALCRFAGLRCPSEVFRLTWADVNFATGRMTVPNVKTAGQTGKAYRVCALFGNLRPYLKDAHELAAPGEVYVVGGVTGDTHRKASRRPGGWVNANLRTTFSKIVHRAGLKQWPRLFQNLRASCETDLLSEYPIASVTAWIGHSAEVALKHYSQVRSADFDRAAGREQAVQNPVQSAARVVQNAVQSGNDLSEPEPTPRAETPVNVGSSSLKCRPVLGSTGQRIDPAGIRTPVSSLKGTCPRPLDDRASSLHSTHPGHRICKPGSRLVKAFPGRAARPGPGGAQRRPAAGVTSGRGGSGESRDGGIVAFPSADTTPLIARRYFSPFSRECGAGRWRVLRKDGVTDPTRTPARAGDLCPRRTPQ